MTTALLSAFIKERRSWLFLLTAGLAICLSFHTIPDSLALTLVTQAGFWFVLTTFVILLHALWQEFWPGLKTLRCNAVDWTSAIVVVAGGVVLLTHEEF